VPHADPILLIMLTKTRITVVMVILLLKKDKHDQQMSLTGDDTSLKIYFEQVSSKCQTLNGCWPMKMVY